jgi:hypothetical protein
VTALKDSPAAVEYLCDVTAAPSSLARPDTRARVGFVPVAVWVTGLVTVSFLLRFVASLGHIAPRLFPDEYIYATLGRSLGHGSTTIRGEPAAFPALLEPLLAAPLWRLAGDDLELGYRLVQGMHALAVSLVAVPVYLIARRIGLSAGAALACSALPLLLPSGVYASYVTADAAGLLLALVAVAIGVAALERPAPATQLLFVAWAGLATLARVQYVVLPVVFVVAAVIVERGSVRRVARDYRLILALLGAGLALVAVAGSDRVLGYYGSVVDLSLDPVAIGRWAATDAFLLAYAAGWVLVPGAVVGLALALFRPAGRAEHAFAALSAALTVLLLAEASIYAANGSSRFQERYLIALLPLVPLLFCVGARRMNGWSVGATAMVAGVLVAVTALVPLSGFTALTGKQDSPLLQAVSRLETAVGVGTASLLVAFAAAAAGVAAVLAARQRDVRLPLALCAAALAVTSVGAVSYDIDASRRAGRTFAGDHAAPTWIDEQRLGPVAVLQTPYSSRQQISYQLFWNASLDRILHMKDASEVDAYGSIPTRIASDGRIVAAGRVVASPMLVEEFASWAQLEGATLVRREVSSALWKPAGTPRVVMLLAGRYLDGWLGARTRLTVWPGANGRRAGVVEMTLSLPDGAPVTTIDLRAPHISRTVVVPPGRTTVLQIPFDTTRPWTAVLRPRTPILIDGARLVSAVASAPRVRERSIKP